MVGIVVDSQRMHVTKEHWNGLLDKLSTIVGTPLKELHTRYFYSGSGIWKKMAGQQRADFIGSVFDWLAERKHTVVYTSVVKKRYFESLKQNKIPSEVGTLWRFLGFHLMLAIQKAHQTHEKTKGNTIFIFDNESKEEKHFVDLVRKSPEWSYEYYAKNKKDEPLNQIVDAPYFADSQDVILIQLADVVSFFLRRFAEIREGVVPAKYADEDLKVSTWVDRIAERSIGCSHIYPQKGRCSCAEMFFSHAPESLRSL